MQDLPMQTIWDVGYNLIKSDYGEDKLMGANVYNKIAKNLTNDHIN
jgi:hypothetical protein